MAKATTRDMTLNIRVSSNDLAMLVALADYYNLARADVVRMLIKKDVENIAGTYWVDPSGGRANVLAMAKRLRTVPREHKNHMPTTAKRSGKRGRQ